MNPEFKKKILVSRGHKRGPSYLEMAMEGILRASILGQPEKEYEFSPGRKWRFDFCYPKYKIAIECEGGVWIRGRHTRGNGFIKDMEKYNQAVALGWAVLRYTSGNMGSVIGDIQQILITRGDLHAPLSVL